MSLFWESWKYPPILLRKQDFDKSSVGHLTFYVEVRWVHILCHLAQSITFGKTLCYFQFHEIRRGWDIRIISQLVRTTDM